MEGLRSSYFLNDSFNYMGKNNYTMSLLFKVQLGLMFRVFKYAERTNLSSNPTVLIVSMS